jgi:hypothetical protein
MKNNMPRYAVYRMVTGLFINFDLKEVMATWYSNQSMKMIKRMPRIKSLFLNNSRNALPEWLKSHRFPMSMKESPSGCCPKKNPVEQTSRKVAVIFSPWSNRGKRVSPLTRLKEVMSGFETLARIINAP